MRTQELDATTPNDVSSAQVLDVFVGEPPRHLLIFTGIAGPHWDSRGDLDRERVIVKLGRTAVQRPKDGEWSATVGLSSIANSDSDFIFATDAVDVDIDQSGQLRLI